MSGRRSKHIAAALCGTSAHLCAAAGVPLVVGSTGFSPEAKLELARHMKLPAGSVDMPVTRGS